MSPDPCSLQPPPRHEPDPKPTSAQHGSIPPPQVRWGDSVLESEMGVQEVQGGWPQEEPLGGGRRRDPQRTQRTQRPILQVPRTLPILQVLKAAPRLRLGTQTVHTRPASVRPTSTSPDAGRPQKQPGKGDGLLSSAKGQVAEGPQGPLLTASPRSSKGMQGSAPGSLGSRAQHLPPLASPSSSGYPPRSCPAHHHGDPRSQSAQRPWVPRIGTRQSSGVRAAGLGGQRRSWPPAPSLSTCTETGRPAKLVSSNFLVLIMLPLAPCSKSVTSSPLLGRIFYF